MKPQKGQKQVITKYFPDAQNIEILAEGGVDVGSTFYGDFVAKIDNHYYTFSDGQLNKKIK